MEKMKEFKSLIIAVLAVIIISGCGSPKQKENEWIQLFNGTNLEGWTPK
jgi:uncharacterized lipoprotein